MNEHADRDRSEAPHVTTRRLRSCVEAWPGCYEGGYDPACCRFPKSCWREVYDPARVTEDELEPATASVVHADGPADPQPSEDTRDGDEARVERYAAAIHGEWWSGASDYAERAVRAVIAVADAEQRPADANGAWNPTYRERWEIVRDALTKQEADTEHYRARAEAADGEIEALRAEVVQLRTALTELAPADEVCIHGDWIPRAHLPAYAERLKKSCDEAQRDAKGEYLRREAAEAERDGWKFRAEAAESAVRSWTTSLREVADEWDSASRDRSVGVLGRATLRAASTLLRNRIEAAE